jgi:hypothetical protein
MERAAFFAAASRVVHLQVESTPSFCTTYYWKNYFFK